MTNYRIILLFSLLFTTIIYSQSVDEVSDFEVNQDGNVIKLYNGNNLLFERAFLKPQFEVIDLDRDGNPELYIKDVDSTSETAINYTLYIYSAGETVKLIDSICSGITEPYFVYSEEIEKLVIVTGNVKFATFIKNDNAFLPINVWQYDGDELYFINQEVYQMFLTESDEICEYLDDYFESNVQNCNSTNEVIAAIASAYADYFNADEQSLALKLLDKYYHCDDLDKFKQKLDTLLTED